MNALAGAIALALALLPAALPAAPRVPPADDGPTVELTTRNWDHAVSLTDPAKPAYAHLFSRSTLTTVSAVIHFGRAEPGGFTATLVDEQAVDGIQPAACSASSAPSQVRCQFDVAVDAGQNDLELTVRVSGSATPIVQRGSITGGSLQWSGGLEAMDAAGLWQAIPDGGELRLPARQFTSVRYVVQNVGGVPFRVRDACADRLIVPGGSLACPLAGPRPAASLATGFTQAIDIEDPLASIGQTSFGGAIMPTRASFSLSKPSFVVGERIVLRTQGLGDRDLGLLDIRLGSRPVRLSTESTPSRIVLAIPFTPPTTTTLDVLESGVTIARLPLEVTALPQPAPSPPFPTALVVTVAIGGALLALLLWRVVTSLVYRARLSRSGTT